MITLVFLFQNLAWDILSFWDFLSFYEKVTSCLLF